MNLDFESTLLITQTRRVSEAIPRSRFGLVFTNKTALV
jgi:hypothetical protein